MSGHFRQEDENLRVIGIILAVHLPNPLFLEKQIKSVLAQTHTDWRLLIVPDGPDHGLPAEVVKQFSRDPRITILEPEEHGGSCRAFERGLTAVSDDVQLLALCDQDDIWFPKKLEILTEQLALNPSSAMVFCDSSIIDQIDRTLSESLRSCESRPKSLSLHSLLARNSVSGHAMLFRRELLQTALPFPAGLGATCLHHDHWLALIASLLGPVVFVPEILVAYRLHDDNMIGPRISKANTTKTFRSWIEQNQKLRNRLESKFACYEVVVPMQRKGRLRLLAFGWKALRARDYRIAGIYFRATLSSPTPFDSSR